MDHKESSAAIHVTKLDGLIDRLTEINRALKEAEKVQGDLMKVHPSYQKSARNLASYLTLRHRDIRQLQQELAELGLSSLGRAEAHVMASLNAVLAAAHAIAARPWQSAPPSPDFREGNSLLRKHTEALLGPAPADRAVRIMVTMPSEAASDYQLVHKLVARGMDCMRINCAYDGPDEWTAMADHLNHAREELRRPCRLSMDLAGPKLRVGPLEPGPEVIKVRPQRDVFGRTVVPARVLLVPAAEAVPSNRTGLPAIAIGSGPLSSLRPGNSLHFVDTRGSSRRMVVSGRVGDCVEAECNRTAYLNSGMELHSTIRGNAILRIGSLRALEQFILLHPGDQLVLSNKPSLGRCPELDDNGKMLSPAVITCTIPEILKDVRPGEKIWFDDGRIGGTIQSATGSEATITVTHAAVKGAKLRAHKGINLPDTNLKIASLTPKDLVDLETVAKQADIVGMSFVRQDSDIEKLDAELLRLGRPDIGILLKIETRKAFDNLPQLVMAAMRRPAAGVMIARGDLAVECGFERMAELQEEILWVCEAAHMPVVWATQVLESLAKTGLASRAEITDAAMGQRAECVMLNKGPHLDEAVAALDNILRRMQDHQIKKSAMLRKLARW